MRKFLLPLCIFFLFLVLISLFLDIRIFGDYTILVGDKPYYRDPTFRTFAPAYFNTRPRNPLMDVDNLRQNYPFRLYVRSAMDRGELPWWNPYIGMGVPFIGLGWGVFDPVALFAGLFASEAKMTNFMVISALLIAALGVFVFLGALGVSFYGRILGAAAFTFSGWTMVWLGRQNFMAEIWMPWLFWSAERLMKESNLRSRKPSASTPESPAIRVLPAMGLLALFTALICLPGHLQTSFHVFIALGLYVLVRLFQTSYTLRGRCRILLLLLSACILGLGMAMVQIMPLMEFVGQAKDMAVGRSIQARTGDASTAFMQGLHGDWCTMRSTIPTALSAVAPLFFGTPRQANDWWPPINLPEATLYVGLLPLFFALYGFTGIRDRPLLRPWLWLVIFSLGLAYALPVFNWINHLPFFDLVNNGRIRGVYRFAVIMAAAMGFDRFIAMKASREGKRSGMLYPFSGFAFFALSAPVAAFIILSFVMPGKNSFLNMDSASLWHFTGSSERHILIFLVLTGLFMVIWKRGFIGTRFFSVLVLLLVYADSFLIFHDFNPLLPSSYVFPETKAVKALKKDPSYFRVSSFLANALPANTKQLYNLFDIDLFAVLSVNRYAKLQSQINPLPFDAVRSFRFSEPASYPGLINLMNVKYVVTPGVKRGSVRREIPFDRLTQYDLFYDQEVRIYENLDVLPRAFLVNKSRIIAPDEILAAVTAPGFDPLQAVLLEDTASPKLSDPGGTQLSSGEADITSFSANRSVVRAETASAAYLVLSETYYPGWKASVDGTEEPMYRAYYLFRAVYLEKGNHEIVLTFKPESARRGTQLSLISLTLTCILLLSGLIRKRG